MKNKTKTLSLRLTEDLHDTLTQLNNPTSYLRGLIIRDLIKLDQSDLIKTSMLENSIEETKKLMQVLNAFKVIYQRVEHTSKRELLILADSVADVLQRQLEATNNFRVLELVKIKLMEIERIKNDIREEKLKPTETNFRGRSSTRTDLWKK